MWATCDNRLSTDRQIDSDRLRETDQIERLLEKIDSILSTVLGFQDYGYYSTLASILHVWRDNAREIFHCYKTIFPDAVSSAALIPPKPISTRWGRKTALEDFLLRCNPDELEIVFTTVLNTRGYFQVVLAQDAEDAAASAAAAAGVAAPARAKPKRRARKAGPVDTIADDEKESYDQKMGKYSKAALRGIRNRGFWLAMVISNRISEALDVLMWCVMKVYLG